MNTRLMLASTLALVALGSLGLKLSLRGDVGKAGFAPAPIRESVIPSRRVLSGQGSCDAPGRKEWVLKDAVTWASWFGKATCQAELNVPVVDFAASQVLAVQGATGANGCYHVRISSVVKADGGGYEARVTRYVPTASMLCTMAMVQPVDAVSVPRSAGPVRFIWTTASGPPEERAP